MDLIMYADKYHNGLFAVMLNKTHFDTKKNIWKTRQEIINIGLKRVLTASWAANTPN